MRTPTTYVPTGQCRRVSYGSDAPVYGVEDDKGQKRVNKRKLVEITWQETQYDGQKAGSGGSGPPLVVSRSGREEVSFVLCVGSPYVHSFALLRNSLFWSFITLEIDLRSAAML